ncbi:OTU domain-containing protein [Paenibacillus cymbidii]|uniref:OTU domain-containing protein n=1 Tax=Paenibacillus cymbidii TaxID=1639034 RepID=UPI0010801E67|nr:OTU domain-containing protein [Paenibacillus cymbidii]
MYDQSPHRSVSPNTQESGSAPSRNRAISAAAGSPYPGRNGISAAKATQLQRAIGNRATGQLLQSGANRSSKRVAPQRDTPIQSLSSTDGVIQGKWLFYNDSNPSNRFYFWKDDGTPKTEAPTIWSSQYKEGPEPDDYYGPDERPRRGMNPAFDLNMYTIQYGNGGQRSTSDTYNPFGRFGSGAATTSFYPNHNMQKERIEELMQRLEKDDSTFERWAAASDEMENGYPKLIKTTKGKVLSQASVSQLGATYSSSGKDRKYATYDKSKTKPLSELKKFTAPIGVDKQFGFGFKSVHNSKVDGKGVSSWSGKKREQSQDQVMGASAGDAAENGGFEKREGEGWEWLHLIAHSMGGIDVEGPQVAGNLVAGTSECNTQMIVVEEFLKDLVSKREGYRAKLSVIATLFDPERHIGERITYDFAIYDDDDDGGGVETFHWTFDCLSRDKPLVSENRNLRKAGRSLFGLDREEGDEESGTLGWKKQEFAKDGDHDAEFVLEKVNEEFLRMMREDDFTAEDCLELLGYAAEELGEIPDSVYVLLGHKSRIGDDKFIYQLLDHFHSNGQENEAQHYMRGLVRSYSDTGYLKELYLEVLEPIFGNNEFVIGLVKSELQDDDGQSDDVRDASGGGPQSGELQEETKANGDCLYEAVNIILGNPMETIGTFRTMATNFITHHPDLANNAGVNMDAIVYTLSTPGAWQGDPGDLAPIILASVIERQINVVTDTGITTIDPLGQTSGAPITLYLSGNHYTVNPVTTGHMKQVGGPSEIDLE